MNLHFSHFIYFQAKVNVACIGTQAVATKTASSNFSTEPIIRYLILYAIIMVYYLVYFYNEK